MGDCLFCDIAKGDIPSAKVYEDENVYAFLDIHPLQEGHVLVIPRSHARYLTELDPEAASALMRGTQRVLTAVHAALGTQDATVAVNDGPAAGQEVPHVHIHVVPRREDDGAGPVHALFDQRPDMDHNAVGALADRIRQGLEASA